MSGSFNTHEFFHGRPDRASAILRQLRCDLIEEEDVLAAWRATLTDPPREGTVRDEIGALVEQALAAVDATRWLPWKAYTAPERARMS